jgi:hypothetical protein
MMPPASFFLRIGALLVGTQKGAAGTENSMEVTQKKKKRGNPYLQGIHIKTPSRNMTP